MIKITVPATSANMGSGFDSIGVALSMYNTFYMEQRDCLEIVSDDPLIPKDETNLVYICVKKVFEKYGKKLSGLYLKSECFIPMARGLGSSSACIVAGVMGANKLLGDVMNTQEIINMCAVLEGHPDNSTPAILGAYCTCVMEDEKVFQTKISLQEKYKFIAFIPKFELKTEKARGVIPKNIPHKDAVYNLSRSALLTSSLITGQTHNIKVAVKDSLHQDYRFPLIENGEEIVKTAYDFGAYGAFISGAGPTILAIIDANDTQYFNKINLYCNEKYPNWQLHELTCDENGTVIS